MSGVVRGLARGTSTIRADKDDWDPETKTVRGQEPPATGQSQGLDQGARGDKPPPEPMTREEGGRQIDKALRRQMGIIPEEDV